MGTASVARKPLATAASGTPYASSTRTSGIWLTARSRDDLAAADAPPPCMGYEHRTASTPSGLEPYTATRRTHSPSKRVTVLASAPHNLTALSAMMSNTGWISVGELEIARRI